MSEKIPATDRDFPSGDRNVEDELFGKWFPRIGALALLLGAGFGYRYAVDQGWVDERLRVMLGLLLGSILIGIGDWSLRQRWSAFSQAITGGGVGILYLTLWAAVGMYGLVPPSVGFICLTGVSGLGCALALRQDSQALALLSLTGGFLNLFVTGAAFQFPEGMYLYVLAVDLGVVLLSFMRPWGVLEKFAFVASWTFVEGSSALSRGFGFGEPPTAILAATGIFVMFAVLPYVRVLLGRKQGVTDLAVVPVNGLLYYFAVFARPELEPLRGPLTLGMAAFFFIGMLIVRGRDKDELVQNSSGVMSFIFLTLWSPGQLGPDLAPLGWAIEALGLMALAVGTNDRRARWAGWLVFSLAGFTALEALGTAPATMLNENYGRVTMIILIATLYVGAYAENRIGSTDMRDIGILVANVLTILWLSVEVYTAVSLDGYPPNPRDLQLGLSSVWGLYAALLLGVGIYLRSAQARMMSLVLFGMTIGKMALQDLWLLDTLQRLVGFAGIGVLLLASSLMYHRFRGWLTPGDQRPS